MAKDGLERVTRAAPCSICQKPDYCCRLTRWHWCMRIESDKPHEKGGWLHKKGEEFTNAEIPPRPKRVSDSMLRDHWTPIARQSEKSAIDKLPLLSLELGVSIESLTAIGVGYSETMGAPCWTFPEKNSRGWIVGITRRLASPTDGQRGKLCARGSRRGLTYCQHWHEYPGVIYIVEGGSDTAAGLTMGLCVIGRPSNVGGVEMLSHILKDHGDRAIIVVGERDKKTALYVQQANATHDPECRCCLMCWPGAAGAKQTALALAKRLGRSVGWTLPTKPHKDLRSLVQSLSDCERMHYAKALQTGDWPPAGA